MDASGQAALRNVGVTDPAQFETWVREQHAEEVGRYAIPFGRGLMGWSVEHAQPILANDALSDPRALQIPGTPEDPEAVVVVPLIADGGMKHSGEIAKALVAGAGEPDQPRGMRLAEPRSGVEPAVDERLHHERQPGQLLPVVHEPGR